MLPGIQEQSLRDISGAVAENNSIPGATLTIYQENRPPSHGKLEKALATYSECNQLPFLSNEKLRKLFNNASAAWEARDLNMKVYGSSEFFLHINW